LFFYCSDKALFASVIVSFALSYELIYNPVQYFKNNTYIAIHLIKNYITLLNRPYPNQRENRGRGAPSINFVSRPRGGTDCRWIPTGMEVEEIRAGKCPPYIISKILY
jgi:hypothetical protein